MGTAAGALWAMQGAWVSWFNFLFGNNFEVTEKYKEHLYVLYATLLLKLLVLSLYICIVYTWDFYSELFENQLHTSCSFALVVVVYSLNLVQLFCDPMDCSPSGFSVHGISQARILEWVAISFSRGSSQPRDGTQVSCFADGFFTSEPPGKPSFYP